MRGPIREREGRKRFVIVVVVEQQIGMHVVGRAVHIGAVRLAGMGIDVHPVPGETLLEEPVYSGP
jgi:hypothetical protein